MRRPDWCVMYLLYHLNGHCRNTVPFCLTLKEQPALDVTMQAAQADML